MSGLTTPSEVIARAAGRPVSGNWVAGLVQTSVLWLAFRAVRS